jgi:two-component system, LytTR family, response regulator
MTYRSIIVEDEKFLAERLQDIVIHHCPEIEISGMAHSSDTATEIITMLKPDLIFMNIEMPWMDAFRLEKLMCGNVDIIFTVYRQTKEGIIRAVQKYIRKKQELHRPGIAERTSVMNGFGNLDKKIRLPTMSGFTMVPVNEIIRLEAAGRYTKVFMKRNISNESNRELISLNIKKFEEQLACYNFFRCHHSHLVNLKNVKSYIKGEGGSLMMENGESIPVSKSKKKGFLKRLNEM